MVQCAVFGCTSDSTKNESEISFHRFPFKNPKTLQIWLDNTGLLYSKEKNSMICSKHFETNCFSKKGLMDHAVPTIFDHKIPLKGERLSSDSDNEISPKEDNQIVLPEMVVVLPNGEIRLSPESVESDDQISKDSDDRLSLDSYDRLSLESDERISLEFDDRISPESDERVSPEMDERISPEPFPEPETIFMKVEEPDEDDNNDYQQVELIDFNKSSYATQSKPKPVIPDDPVQIERRLRGYAHRNARKTKKIQSLQREIKIAKEKLRILKGVISELNVGKS